MFVFSRFMRYFLEIARLGSIRKASETLNVSASAIDRQILAAEEELGVPLFERLPSGLRVTAAGELLLTSCGRWTKEFAQLQAQIDDLIGLKRGHVRIAAIDALSKGFLPGIIQALRQDYPGITMHLTVVDNVVVQGLIQRGEVDFGLMLSPQSSKDIVVQSHRDIILGFATPPDHPLAGRDGVRFNRCIEFPIIARSTTSSRRSNFVDWFVCMSSSNRRSRSPCRTLRGVNQGESPASIRMRTALPA